VALSVLLALNPLLFRPSQRRLEVRVDELTRTRSGALDVQASELRRIERDLHDGAQARLVALSMQLGRAEERLADHPDTAALVRQARAEATAAIRELRDLARGIAPPVLADRGLVAAVEALASRSTVNVAVDGALDQRLPPVVEAAAHCFARGSWRCWPRRDRGDDHRRVLAVLAYLRATGATVSLARHAQPGLWRSG
jgi:signal transduction histidine kinase